jgi:hypothetical protein
LRAVASGLMMLRVRSVAMMFPFAICTMCLI